ncbi:arginase family protein [Rhodococcus sp. WS1]|uniref:arginase family protein n=2 Tax=unclassified Rhodococcus (in: high G+C Gram-positive bacteria) TaxID=192944 RepID=UPI0011419300|nr:MULTISPECIES: arginase family protein [unclassified Rhodococcus (in: high G+C Gram-positive bacteria)]TQC36094.1 hypothetical protein EEB16_21355 [Rhodococcus sp. WS7]
MCAPFDAGHTMMRMGTGPANLLAHGLIDRLEQSGCRTELVEIAPPVGDWCSELRTGFAVQRAVRVATADAVSAGAFPVLLSGDCNTSVGVIAGLQAGGVDPGFVWCDAHADFHTPATDRFGSLDCQGLAMLAGRAWRELVRQMGLRPLRDSRVVLVGARSVDRDEFGRSAPGTVLGLQNAMEKSLKSVAEMIGKARAHE